MRERERERKRKREREKGRERESARERESLFFVCVCKIDTILPPHTRSLDCLIRY